MGGGPYLNILQNGAETSGDRFERRESICGVADGTEKELGCSGCSSRSILSISPLVLVMVRGKGTV
jgi:hypothetical protein